ncbi:MAG: RloB family protein [Sphaerochaetaceae bacterium]
MSGKTIGYTSKKRNSGIRKEKKIILIATEGNNQTETNYFKKFKTSGYRIKFVHGNDTDPVKMMQALKAQFESLGLSKADGDLGMSLIDTDCADYKNVQINAADKLSDQSIKQYVSSPCFEIWLLCHFVYSTKQYNSSDEVIKELRERIDGYSKNQEDIIEKTISKLPTALKNAKMLNEFCLSSGKKPHTVGFMPSTEIYKIIEILDE